MSRRFSRTSVMHSAGSDAAILENGRVVDVNLVNWTVDVVTSYDQKWHFDIQVASPYLHHANGEGFYVMPEVGAICVVAIPSDSSPPYVVAFLSPAEIRNDGALVASGNGQPQQNASSAAFSAGRPRAKAGDIVLRGRDDNFVILHRGGVLQLGATPLAQRVYFPLNNLVTDMTYNYQQQAAGGSVSWGIQEGPSIDHPPTQHMQVFRVFADDKYADIRVATGKVYNPLPEPDGDKGETEDLEQLHIGTDDDGPIIMEVGVAKNGFVAESGVMANPGVRNQTVLRFFFDRKGGTFLRATGNVLLSAKKKLRLKVEDDLEIECKKNINITAEGDLNLRGAVVSINGDVVRMGQGQKPVAAQGDIVTVMLPFTPMMASPTPIPVQGTILSGNPRVLV